MKLSVIHSGLFKLDGGAMFGVVPKSIWEKLEQPDEQNLCTWSMRCLLIETGDRKILIDTGLGNKQSDKFFSYYQPHGPYSLATSLHNHKVDFSQITDVLLTHLHFDHVGGAVIQDNQSLIPAFSQAKFWSNQKHWNWAIAPNSREKASFLKENFMPLEENKVLYFTDAGPYSQITPWIEHIDLIHVYGHTEAMALPLIDYFGKKICYCADLLPSPSHIPLPYVMGYDTRPLFTMEEKSYILEKAVEENWILFFEHAKEVEACTLTRDEKGKIIVSKTGDLADFLN
jgi:glyoxylase-like metal-dependent hydrolase (beta-lactamase superfamily II)